MGGGLKSKDSEEADPSDDSEDSGDTDLAELGAKYGSRLAEAVDAKDGAAVYSALCKLIELHSYEEDQERGY